MYNFYDDVLPPKPFQKLKRTKSFKKIRGFDKRYFLYFEDFDLSLRMSKVGKLVYAPNVKITHGGGGASKKGLWYSDKETCYCHYNSSRNL